MRSQSLRLCTPAEIRCPKCGAQQHNTHLGRSSHVFRECQGKLGAARQHCGMHLFVTRSAGAWCTVHAVTKEERDELVRQLDALEAA
jgi:hypothetical protein